MIFAVVFFILLFFILCAVVGSFSNVLAIFARQVRVLRRKNQLSVSSS